MLKFLLLLFLIIFLLSIAKIFSYVLRFLIWLFAPDTKQNSFSNTRQNRSHHKKAKGTISIEHIPGQKKKNKKTDFQGGEYIDYEEIS
ncbi:MAG: hypothetical protein FVQ77_02335 [Cytophagales bacterium]|nr:hypothetical protein [Cytophagales bacterium]